MFYNLRVKSDRIRSAPLEKMASLEISDLETTEIIISRQ